MDAADSSRSTYSSCAAAGSRRAAAARLDAYEAIRRGRYLRTGRTRTVRSDSTPASRPTTEPGWSPRSEAEADRLGRRGEEAGVDGARRALAADALVAWCALAVRNRARVRNERGGSRGTGPATMVHVRVDHESHSCAGHAEPGEICEIPGIGPIPVEVAHRSRLRLDPQRAGHRRRRRDRGRPRREDHPRIGPAGHSSSGIRCAWFPDAGCVTISEIDHVEPLAPGWRDQPVEPGPAVSLAPLPEDEPATSPGAVQRGVAMDRAV